MNMCESILGTALNNLVWLICKVLTDNGKIDVAWANWANSYMQDSTDIGNTEIAAVSISCFTDEVFAMNCARRAAVCLLSNDSRGAKEEMLFAMNAIIHIMRKGDV